MNIGLFSRQRRHWWHSLCRRFGPFIRYSLLLELGLTQWTSAISHSRSSFVTPNRLTAVRDIVSCQRVLAVGRNLFQRAIIHGGSALSTWSITDEPMVYARRLADRVNCSSSSSTSRPTSTSLMHTADLLHCLKQRNADQLVGQCWCLTDCAPWITNLHISVVTATLYNRRIYLTTTLFLMSNRAAWVDIRESSTVRAYTYSACDVVECPRDSWCLSLFSLWCRMWEDVSYCTTNSRHRRSTIQ